MKSPTEYVLNAGIEYTLNEKRLSERKAPDMNCSVSSNMEEKYFIIN